MPKTTSKHHLAMAAGAALLMGGCATSQKAEQPESNTYTDNDMGQCHGANACKGAGSCATASNNCAGENSCKGKGWLPFSKSDCDKRDGKFIGFK